MLPSLLFYLFFSQIAMSQSLFCHSSEHADQEAGLVTWVKSLSNGLWPKALKGLEQSALWRNDLALWMDTVLHHKTVLEPTALLELLKRRRDWPMHGLLQASLEKKSDVIGLSEDIWLDFFNTCPPVSAEGWILYDHVSRERGCIPSSPKEWWLKQDVSTTQTQRFLGALGRFLPSEMHTQKATFLLWRGQPLSALDPLLHWLSPEAQKKILRLKKLLLPTYGIHAIFKEKWGSWEPLAFYLKTQTWVSSMKLKDLKQAAQLLKKNTHIPQEPECVDIWYNWILKVAHLLVSNSPLLALDILNVHAEGLAQNASPSLQKQWRWLRAWIHGSYLAATDSSNRETHLEKAIRDLIPLLDRADSSLGPKAAAKYRFFLDHYKKRLGQKPISPAHETGCTFYDLLHSPLAQNPQKQSSDILSFQALNMDTEKNHLHPLLVQGKESFPDMTLLSQERNKGCETMHFLQHQGYPKQKTISFPGIPMPEGKEHALCPDRSVSDGPPLIASQAWEAFFQDTKSVSVMPAQEALWINQDPCMQALEHLRKLSDPSRYEAMHLFLNHAAKSKQAHQNPEYRMALIKWALSTGVSAGIHVWQRFEARDLKLSAPPQSLYPWMPQAWVQAFFPKESFLLHAIARHESSLNPQSYEPHFKTYGLMQLKLETAQMAAQHLGWPQPQPKDLMDPAKNLTLGLSYMRYLLRFFSGSLPLALLAYNMGPYTVEKQVHHWKKKRTLTTAVDYVDFLEALPVSRSRDYVHAILRDLFLYRLLGNDPISFQALLKDSF